MRIIGIDPGKNGGIAVFDGGNIDCGKTPATTADFWHYLAGLDPAVCFVEKVHSTPQMGVSSAFTFGKSVGIIEAVVIAAGLRLVYVSPQKWQKELGLISKARGLGKGDTEKKNRNKARAQELFPELEVTHAVADALLICEYGRRTTLTHPN